MGIEFTGSIRFACAKCLIPSLACTAISDIIFWPFLGIPSPSHEVGVDRPKEGHQLLQFLSIILSDLVPGANERLTGINERLTG